jgi:hypothetical protein
VMDLVVLVGILREEIVTLARVRVAEDATLHADCTGLP